MADRTRRERRPRAVVLDRIYTRTGDRGQTRLAAGRPARKDDPRIEAYGQVDELNACIGLARQAVLEAAGGDDELGAFGATLLSVQHRLFDLGSLLCTLPEDVHPAQARIDAAHVGALERELDRRNAGLSPLRSFVLPGGCRANAALHLARTVCRRAERACVTLDAESPLEPPVLAYLNRLGDALFVWSRWVSQHLGAPESLWEPGPTSPEVTDSRSARSRGTPRARSSSGRGPRTR